MKKMFLVLSIFFTILTFAGAIYVLTSHGTANAGYAVVPMVIGLACLSGYRTYRNKDDSIRGNGGDLREKERDS